MTIKYSFCLFLIVLFPSGMMDWNYWTLDRNDDSEIILGQFIDAVNAYCEQDYHPDHKIFIEDQLLAAPYVDFVNDIPGIQSEQAQANSYFRQLKREKVRVRYERDFELKECTRNGEKVWGGILEKSLLNEQQQVIASYKEFVELSTIGGLVKIESTSSSLFPSYSEIQCDRAEVKQDCPLLTLANQAYAGGKTLLALEYYQQALACGVQQDLIEGRIQELRSVKRIEEALARADQLYRQKDYDTALPLYELVETNETLVGEAERRRAKSRLQECKQQIQFLTAMQSGDYYLQREFYERALGHYEEALAVFPNNTEASGKRRRCKRALEASAKENILREIARAEALIKKRKPIKAMKIYMKYRQSGYLKGLHFFQMAQIMNTRPKEIKKQYRLSNRDCCVLTRQYCREARNLEYSSEAFETFWDYYLNKKSRTCD